LYFSVCRLGHPALLTFDVIPAEAGIQTRQLKRPWIPASAGMTADLRLLKKAFVGAASAARIDEAGS